MDEVHNIFSEELIFDKKRKTLVGISQSWAALANVSGLPLHNAVYPKLVALSEFNEL